MFSRFTFTPCLTCFGIANISILLVDKPTELELESLNATDYITLVVQAVNNVPVIFMVTKSGEYMLSIDPTEDIIVCTYLSQRALLDELIFFCFL